MEIMNRERWEQWAISQPPSRQFDYCDACGCAIHAFIKETVSKPDVKLIEPADLSEKE